MLRSWLYCSLLVFTYRPLTAQTPSTDLPTTQAMLAEIRQLRSDLQIAAATIQRVNIVMFRLQTQAAVADRLTQKVDQVHAQCDQAESNQKMFAVQLEDAQADRGGVQDTGAQMSFDRNVARLKSALVELTIEVPRCQADQAVAETELRNEQNKMNELQDQLERLDKALAVYGGK
jgi:chromosome segregation ATPase